MKKIVLCTLLLLNVGLSFGLQLPKQEERALVRREMTQEQPTAEQRAQASRKAAKETACVCARACACLAVIIATTFVAGAYVAADALKMTA